MSLGSVESIARPRSNSNVAIRCNISNPSLQRKLIAVVVSIHPKGHRKWLQRVTGKAPRTCDYWLAGQTQMEGDAFAAVVAQLRVEIDAHNDTLRQFELDFG